MLISIVIPTCNRNKDLSKCLNLLHFSNQGLTENDYEVIVTDDGKNNDAKPLIDKSYTWVKWVEGPKKGPAANRNNGAKQAIGDWLLFLDDDCIPDKSIVEQYIKATKEYSDCNVFEGCIKPEREKRRFDEEAPINLTGGYLWSCNFMINYKTFFTIGQFDDNFPFATMEDVDLRYRLCELGISIVFLYSAFVVHPWRINRGIEIYKNRDKSIRYYLAKHPKELTRISKRYHFLSFINTIKSVFKYGFKYRFRGFKHQVILAYVHISRVFNCW